MRMWMVNVKGMCRKHLLGEHVECHMIASSVRDGKSLDGYVDSNALQLRSLVVRHDTIAKEMGRRGYKHKSPLRMPQWNDQISLKAYGSKVDRTEAQKELHRRCPDCRKGANV